MPRMSTKTSSVNVVLREATCDLIAMTGKLQTAVQRLFGPSFYSRFVHVHRTWLQEVYDSKTTPSLLLLAKKRLL